MGVSRLRRTPIIVCGNIWLGGAEVNKILIVVDMQNDFIDGILGTPEAAAIVPAVIKKIRTFGGSIFFTRIRMRKIILRRRKAVTCRLYIVFAEQKDGSCRPE